MIIGLLQVRISRAQVKLVAIIDHILQLCNTWKISVGPVKKIDAAPCGDLLAPHHVG